MNWIVLLVSRKTLKRCVEFACVSYLKRVLQKNALKPGLCYSIDGCNRATLNCSQPNE